MGDFCSPHSQTNTLKKKTIKKRKNTERSGMKIFFMYVEFSDYLLTQDSNCI